MLITSLRKEYTLGGLRRKDLHPDPIQQFHQWLEQALQTQGGEPYAMTLATADKKGRPSARTVLLRGVDERGFLFFTNYESQKGRELEENPHAALVFFWDDLERQVCVKGTVEQVSRAESETYFKTRPLGNRLAAWASNQSRMVRNREVLEEKLKRMRAKFNAKSIPLPSYWGGYVLTPTSVEFWQGRPNRLHDRFRYTRTGKVWVIERLAP